MKTIKFLLTTIAVLLCSVMANAHDFEVDGIYYNILSSTELTVEVTKGRSSNSYYGYISIPSTVTHEDKIYSVTSIEYGAFSGCSSLTSITIPESVTSIGRDAFSGCSSLTSITIPNSVTSIEYGTFYDCSSLTSVIIGDGVTNIGEHAFSGCLGMTSVTIGNGVTMIGPSAFYNCSSLTSITIPNNVTNIGYDAFSGCSNLQSLIIGIGVQSIGRPQTFEPTKVIWLPNTPPYGYQNFTGKINYVPNDQYYMKNKYTYPFLSSMFEVNGIKFVPIIPSERTCDIIDCIYDSTTLQITIDSTINYKRVDMTVKKIMPYAFYNNKYIKDLSVANSGNIEKSAFGKCENIENLIVSNLGYVGDSTFAMCKKLKTLTISNQGHIHSSAFSWCSNLKTATISNEGNIESYAFYGCSSLTTVRLSNCIKALGDAVFARCDSLQEITLSNSIKSMGKRCFQACYAMKSAIIGDGIDSIKEETFYHCTSLEDLTIGNSVTTIEKSAFAFCTSLSKIIIPRTVISIENSVFRSCSALTDVIIEDRSTPLKLGSNRYDGSFPLFEDCPLDSIYIGGKITYNTSKKSGYSPFYRNTSLRTITITDQEDQIYENEFYGCTNLNNVTIGNGIKIIGDRAFSGCSSLDKFSFGSNVESIGTEAFSDCVNMTQLVSRASIPPICGTQALDDINKWLCVLKIPQNCIAAYQEAEQWKEFFFIEDVVEVKKYAVIYMVDNEIFATDSLAVGDSIVPIAEPTKEGYTFSGWSEVPETMPAHDVEIYGNFFLSSAVDNIDVPTKKSQKVIENNQLFILLPNGKKYNVMGQKL